MLLLDKKLLLILAIIFIAFNYTATAQCNGSVDLPADITICNPDDVSLSGTINGEYLFFEWTSDQGYQNSSDINPTVFVDETTTFNLSAQLIPNTGSNLITNGDFESGNTGFTTQYTYVVGTGPMAIWAEGTYAVGTSPLSYHMNFDPCTDHTSGSGNMMIVNGSGSLSQIWCQTITVNPNTYYVFNAWATSVENASPAILQFAIEGNLIGSPLNLSTTTCDWENFYAIWFSGSETSVDICVTDQNTTLSGNDFALDDISFIEACEVNEDITITVVEFEAQISGNDLINCAEPTSSLMGEAFPANANYTYGWNTFDGNYSLGSNDMEIVVESEGTYFFTVTDENNCTRSSEYIVYQDFELPEAELVVSDTLDCETPDVLIKNLISLPHYNYAWYGPDDFSSDERDVIVNQAGLYIVTVTNTQNSCESIYSVEVFLDESYPIVTLNSSGNLTCSVKTTTITTNNPLYDYVWSGPGVSGNTGTSVNVNQAGTYSVTATDDNGCTAKGNISISQTPSLLSNINVDQDTITCLNSSIQLSSVISGSIDSIVWSDADSFYSNVLLPLVADSGWYYVMAFDPNGCVLSDSVWVNADLNVPIPTTSQSPVDCITKTGSFTINETSGLKFLYNLTANSALNFNEAQVVTNAGSYIIQTTANNGCSDTLSIFVDKNEDYPANEISATDINCNAVVSNVIVNTNMDSVAYFWYNDTGFISNDQNISTSNGGTYILKSVSNLGCESFDTIIIAIDTLSPSFEFKADAVNCYSPFVNPDLLYADDNLAYTWNGPNINNFNGIPNQLREGLYSIKAKGMNGCTTEKKLTISSDLRLPLATFSGIDTLNCKTTNLNVVCNAPSGIIIEKWSGIGYVVNDSFSINVNQPGSFSLIGHHPVSGCKDTFAFYIPQDISKPELTINTDSVINCINKVVKKTAVVSPFNAEINWKTNTGIVTGKNHFINIYVGGNFSVEAIHPTSFCVEKKKFVIVADTAKPVFTLSFDSLSCKKDLATISFNTNISNEITFANSDVIKTANSTFTTPLAGIKQISVTAENGCVTERAIEIIIDTLRPHGLVDFTNIDCTEKPASILASTDENIRYNLLHNNTLVSLEKSFETSVTGPYTATFLNEKNGCTYEIDFEITKINNGPHGLSFELPFSCDRYSEAFVFDKVTFANGVYNLWVDDIALTNSGVEPLELSSGQHSLKLVDALGCETDTVFFIKEYEIPFISDELSLEINYGDQVQFEINTSLSSKDIKNISWLPTDYLSCSDCVDPICNAPDNMYYTVSLQDNNGCILQSAVRVDVKYNVDVFFPNIIRTGSGINESFYPSANPYVEVIEYLKIYDRWGNQVFNHHHFTPNEPSYGWQGKLNNADLNPGVYVYVCRAKTVKGDLIDFAGDVTLVR